MDQRRKQREMKKYLRMNGNEDTTHQTLWNAAKAVLGINSYIQKEERSQINNLRHTKEERTKSKAKASTSSIRAVSQAESKKLLFTFCDCSDKRQKRMFWLSSVPVCSKEHIK